MTSKTSGVAVLCLALMAGAGAALLWRRASAPVELATGSYLSPRRALPDFSLIDQRGRTFGPLNLRGHWSLMFFGYTNCPDFCPSTLTTLAAMEQHMRSKGAAVRPQVLFVSVDAKRDTPQQLSKYVPYFDPEFTGITAGDQDGIEAFARKLGVAVFISPKADGGYTVDHSGAIFVIDPAGELAAILTGPFAADALAADFAHIAASSG